MNDFIFGVIPRKVYTSNTSNASNANATSNTSEAFDCLCDWRSSKLRKHDGYLNVMAYQFLNPLDDLTNEQKDFAIANHGSVPSRTPEYASAFHGKILPPKRPFGKFEHPVNNKRINAYRQSTQICERGPCCADDCREYGDALERYLECRERCPKQDMKSVTAMCGPPPINPAENNCKKNWVQSYSSKPGGWSPDLAYRKM